MKILFAASFALLPILSASAQPAHKSGSLETPRASTTGKSSKSNKSKSCVEYGPGFLRVPGTTTCIKVGGSIDVEGRVH